MGGFEDRRNHFRPLQRSITDLMRDEHENGSDSESDDDLKDYKDFLKNIKCVNTLFNVKALQPQTTGECGIDIVYEKPAHTGEEFIVIMQRVKKIQAWNIITAVLLVGLRSNNAWFTTNPSISGSDQNSSYHESSLLASLDDVDFN